MDFFSKRRTQGDAQEPRPMPLSRILALLLVVVGMLAFASGAQAASVTPQVVDGNPKCEDYGLQGAKVEPPPAPANGATDQAIDGPLTFNVTYTGSATFNWSATGEVVDKVIVKGGSQANVYTYSPEASSDTNLTTPNNASGGPADISHIEACYDVGNDSTGTSGGGATGQTLPGQLAPFGQLVCGRRPVSLISAKARGNRVRLRGLVAERFAGRRVTILNNLPRASALRRITTVRSSATGAFTALVPRPSRRQYKTVRYKAQVSRFRSVSLKLPQFLRSTSISAVGTRVTVRGQVKRSVLGRRNPVVIKRLFCGRYRTVGSARPNRRGRYVVSFNVAPGVTNALFRAETRVLRRRGGRTYVKQYARAIGIRLTGQTG